MECVILVGVLSWAELKDTDPSEEELRSVLLSIGSLQAAKVIQSVSRKKTINAHL